MYRPHRSSETIAALATPPGEGGIAIIRISGKDALKVADLLFNRKVSHLETHTIQYGFIRDSEGRSLDEVLLLIMKAPRSFTGEDIIEIHCHGGMMASRKILERSLEVGARLALPGEFAFKAFLNGKIDLAQAEGIASLIASQSDLAFQEARALQGGHLSKKIKGYQKKLNHLAALFEAWVDFPEEGLEFASFEEIEAQMISLETEMKGLLDSYSDGSKIKEGISIALVGLPNVGKSSLLNALAGYERAIVTPIQGTTRDTLEEEILFGDLRCRLIDTAGFRKTTNLIEKEGIKRGKSAMERADLVLFILDASRKLLKEEETFLENLPEKGLVIWNKMDEAHLDRNFHPAGVQISAKEGTGIDVLKMEIQKKAWEGCVKSKSEIILTHERHRDALLRAYDYLKTCRSKLRCDSPEFLAYEIRSSLREIGSITGEDVTEEILTSIFSTFCIGK